MEQLEKRTERISGNVQDSCKNIKLKCDVVTCVYLTGSSWK